MGSVVRFVPWLGACRLSLKGAGCRFCCMKNFSFVRIIYVSLILDYNFFMKRLLSVLILLILTSPCSFAGNMHAGSFFSRDMRAVKSLLNSQVKYANKTDFDKFISTYDENYLNSDGFNLEVYSKIVKDIWTTYDNIEYGLKIKNITVKDDSALAEVEETCFAYIPAPLNMDGILESESDSTYNLKKIDGKWKVVSDTVLRERTSVLYGEAKGLNIKLTAPEEIQANTEYTASLEFVPPQGLIAIASIANDKVEYPQKQAEEVFRRFPNENILERLFVSNKDSVNEYVIASIGLTKTDVTDWNIKLRLTGFGYQITRVNVVSQPDGEQNAETK